MDRYVWPKVFKNQLRNKFVLDKNGYIKYPPNIEEILNIIEDAIRQDPAPRKEQPNE